MKELKKTILGWIPIYEVYLYLKRYLLLKEYRERREHYEVVCKQQGLKYEEDQVAKQIQKHIAKRGYTPSQKVLGDIHTFAYIPRIGWHKHLYADLYELGPVTEFDYTKYGYSVQFYNLRDGHRRRAELNALVLAAIRAAHAQRAIDLVFFYATGRDISANTIRRIQEEIGVPVVNMCLDDKQSWAGEWMGDHRGDQIDIASAFDLSWSSARIACNWYLAEGGRPLYMPPGCNASFYGPRSVSQDIPVSFIGGAYGFRAKTVRFAKRYGITVQTFGQGWNTGSVSDDEAVEIICRSRINLGMGGIGYSEWLTNVKARDVEIPCTGGGVYITSYNPDLALHFDIGKEIVCYRTNDELVELLRYYLAHPDEATEIAQRGRERCLKEHRWLHRYVKICKVLGIVKISGD